LVERYVRNVEVGGSSPLTSTPKASVRAPRWRGECEQEDHAHGERRLHRGSRRLEAKAHQRRSGWRSLPATYVIVHRLRWKRPDPSDESATDLWAEATSRLATAADVCGVNPKGASVEVQAVHDTLARM
jgi:hypothetical protein